MSPMEAAIFSFNVELKIFSFKVRNWGVFFSFLIFLFFLKIRGYFKDIDTEKVFSELKIKYENIISSCISAMAAQQVEGVLTCKDGRLEMSVRKSEWHFSWLNLFIIVFN